MSSVTFSQCVERYIDFCTWEKKIVRKDQFQEFCDLSPNGARLTRLPGAILLGTARAIIDPIAGLVGIVALPILAKVKKDKSYLYAAGFALLETAFIAGFVSLCVFVFSPAVSISLSVVFVVVVKWGSTLVYLQQEPREYREVHGAARFVEHCEEIHAKRKTQEGIEFSDFLAFKDVFFETN